MFEERVTDSEGKGDSMTSRSEKGSEDNTTEVLLRIEEALLRIQEKLDVSLGLKLVASSEGRSKKEVIGMLNGVGLGTSAIASALNTSPNNVRAQLSQIRKDEKKKAGKRKASE